MCSACSGALCVGLNFIEEEEGEENSALLAGRQLGEF